MDDSESEPGCLCRGCCLCQGPLCCCRNCFCSFLGFVKRKCVSLTLLALGWAAVIVAFILIDDPDWNIAVVPYLCTFVACALTSVTCKRGRYERVKLVDARRPAAAGRLVEVRRRPAAAGTRRPATTTTTTTTRRPTARRRSEDFVEIYSADEVSPLLSDDADRNGRVEDLLSREDHRGRVEDPEQLFEPPPNFREQSAQRRNSQLTFQADVHRPTLNEPASPPLVHEDPASPPSQPSTSTPDSGVAVQSTDGQSTESGGPVLRPPPPEPETPSQDPPDSFPLD